MMETETLKPGPIIPPEAAPLRNLTVTMAVMCYLACLAIGALILIDRAVDGWTRGLSREVTVQLRQIERVDMEAELQKAVGLLQASKGVVSAEPLAREAGLKLLEPWLGSTNLEELPVPRLIRVTIDENNQPDFEALDKNLKDNIQGASLDTHRRWEAELTRMAHTLSLLSYLILALICASAIAMVIFAARSVLEANREVVDVLHLVGAKDGYITRQIDRRFMATGMAAGFIGIVLALVTFLILGFSGTVETNSVAAASYSLLFSPSGTSYSTYGLLLFVPVAATAIALLSARMTLMRMLKSVS
jgi:cell division transport system permease protein